MGGSLATDDGVQEIIDLLESDVIDDPEELLVWLGTDGVVLLKEFLVLRGGLLTIALEILDGPNPDDSCYNAELVRKLNTLFGEFLELPE